jgi:hypothetical protein
LSTDDPLCQPGASVYGPDFADAVQDRFERDVSTFTDVQEALGTYLYDREPRVTTADGYSSFRCWYDFNGDRIFPVIFRFSGENDTVVSIHQRLFDSP